MAKGSRGGKRNSGFGATQTANNQQPQVDDTQTAQAMSSTYDNFMAMSDDEKADVISSMTKQAVPDHLADNDFQKMLYNIGLNDRPQSVDDDVLDTMNGTELFRTVNNVYDKQHDLSYSADQIARQVTQGRATRVSDNGGSAYGRGIYFADDYRESSYYGNANGNVKQTAVIRCKLNSNAKVITYNSAINGLQREMSSGSKLGNTLKKCDIASQVSIYAMAKGYNAIYNQNSYYTVLNRNAVTMSKTINPLSNKWK